MDLHQQLVARVLYPLQRWRKGEWTEVRYLREYDRTQYLSQEGVRNLQWARLQHRLHHAYEHCRYYRVKWNSLGLHPNDLRQAEDLSHFPVLTKADIQQHLAELVADNIPKSSMFLDCTGGSTGRPISYYQSYDVDLSRKAGTIRHNRWAGYDIGDKAAFVWGAPRDIPGSMWKSSLRNALFDRRWFLDTACFTNDKMRAFNRALRQYRPKVIVAYARALRHLAAFLRAEGEAAYRPQAIITSAEVLDPEDREVIEGVFGCKIFDRYGCREVGVIASECEHHEGMHVNAEGLYVEVVVGNRPARPGELGKLLVTDLLNFAMPLVRYEIGDMAIPLAEPCACGRGLPRLANIAGRVTDFVVGPDGRLVSGVYLATYVIAKRPTLGQVQIYQDTPGKLTYRIATSNRSAACSSDLEYLTKATREHVGIDTKVSFEFVEELACEPSGKFLFCKSDIR